MSEQNQNQNSKDQTTSSSSTNTTHTANTPETPKHEGTQAQAVHTSGWRKLLAKKWVFPATYMAAAAIILTLVWVYQGANQKPLDPNTGAKQTAGQTVGQGTAEKGEGQALEVIASTEALGWPVANAQDVEVVMSFFDANASKEEQVAATVEYKQTFTPNVGIDLARKDQQPFDVLAALSGKVTRSEHNPVMGQVVELDHGNGVQTVYQSLTDVTLKKGDEVKKGDVIGKAGRSEMEKSLGNHLHFGVYEDNKPVNPTTLLAKN
ncbi:M23 family metallopeptidase [Paenibacillus sp. 481]|uniref:M23 family metallopeptidase n=1 Tax=Paenibacillus sp. 481 TaxID=2835869 RepID=UPI001E282FC4|nr:M23 family metallopeptidase [Paenibacillus sp. 481]UHA75680.1 M23 family metallopeptidase [Paenibacillus sp. 481]